MKLLDWVNFHAKDTPSKGLKTARHGIALTIEHPKGATRALHDDKGNVVYNMHMKNDYGFINNTKGRDGDETDVMLGPMKDAKEVHTVHMIDKGPVPSAREDEDKVMMGFPSADTAKSAFLAHYPAEFYGGMTSLPVDEFKNRLKATQVPHANNKIHAGAKSCPNCGSKKYGLMPTDFETAKCSKCGKNFEVGA